MTKKEKQMIVAQVAAMSGVIGTKKINPVLLRVFLQGYYFGIGMSVKRASHCATNMAKDIEANANDS